MIWHFIILYIVPTLIVLTAACFEAKWELEKPKRERELENAFGTALVGLIPIFNFMLACGIIVFVCITSLYGEIKLPKKQKKC